MLVAAAGDGNGTACFKNCKQLFEYQPTFTFT
jgi:hypothetical protein